jgi:spermidine synthase
MTPWTLLDEVETPEGSRLELRRRGPDYSIRAGGQLLMNSRVHGSEESLAELGLAALGIRPRAQVLVGGLGFGYTLAAALRHTGADATVTVSELMPAVVRWNRELVGELADHPLQDSRVQVAEGDIVALLKARTAAFDVILLDVDNGPRAMAQDSNAWLYSPAGLTRMGQALRSRGVVAVWSAGPEVKFSGKMAAAGFNVSLHRVRVSPTSELQRHMIWVGTKRQ